VKKYSVFILVFLAILILGCTQVQLSEKSPQSVAQSMTVEEVIEKMKERYNNFQDLQGIVNMSMKVENTTMYEVGRFIVKKPDKFRVESKELLYISNGKVIWLYNKVTNEYTVANISNIDKPETLISKIGYGFLFDVFNNSKKKLLSVGKFKDKECYLIVVPPTNENPRKIQVWVDKQELYPLKVEISGNQTIVITYEDVKFNSGVSDELFNFTPPEGAKMLKPS